MKTVYENKPQAINNDQNKINYTGQDFSTTEEP
jgi:hypothetical protein